VSPQKIFSRYLRATTSNIDEVRPTLWTDVGAEQYAEPAEKYQAAILEQYKIYLEMADRISARRGLTNTFFLTLNTLILTTIGVLWKDRPTAGVWYLAVPLAALLLQCGAWFWLLRSPHPLGGQVAELAASQARRASSAP
jgi:hypothetical protein